MQTVVIKRKPSYNLRSGKIKIYGNEKQLAIIDESINEVGITVEEGEKIWAELQWCSSNKVEITPNIKELVLSSFLSNKSFIIILFIILACTLFALLTKYTFFGLGALLVALYPLYYITLGRKKYLRLSS